MPVSPTQVAAYPKRRRREHARRSATVRAAADGDVDPGAMPPTEERRGGGQAVIHAFGDQAALDSPRPRQSDAGCRAASALGASQPPAAQSGTCVPGLDAAKLATTRFFAVESTPSTDSAVNRRHDHAPVADDIRDALRDAPAGSLEVRGCRSCRRRTRSPTATGRSSLERVRRSAGSSNRPPR